MSKFCVISSILGIFFVAFLSREASASTPTFVYSKKVHNEEQSVDSRQDENASLLAFLSQHSFELEQEIIFSIDDVSSPLTIAKDSRPEEGFYRLNYHADNRTYNAGYIVHKNNRIMASITLPGSPKQEIIETQQGVKWNKALDFTSEPITLSAKPSEKLFSRALSKAAVSDYRLQNIGSQNIPPESVANAEAPMTIPLPDSHDKIDILLLFDPRLLAAYPNENGDGAEYDLNNRINGADALIKSVFARSGFEVTHNIVAVLPYRPAWNSHEFPTESSSDILRSLIDSAYALSLKDRFQADGIHYIGAEDEGICGRANIANFFDLSNQLEFSDQSRFVGYSRLSCLGNGAYAHEVGHNLGFRHDRHTIEEEAKGGFITPPKEYHIPYGYIEPEGDFYTTMAYSSSCHRVATDPVCFDEAIYSNPLKTSGEKPLGVDESFSHAADAARAGRLSSTVMARLDSFTQVEGIKQRVNDDGLLELTWPTYDEQNIPADTRSVDAEYVIGRYHCSPFIPMNQNALNALSPYKDGQAILDWNSEYAEQSCIFARFSEQEGNSSFSLLGRIENKIKNSDGGVHY